MKILLHACCGPCATFPVKALREAGHELHGFFYNPNIHPFQEYQRRLEAFQQFANRVDLPVIIKDDYEIEKFFRETAYREELRCRYCYHIRLAEAARFARKGRFEAFTTTLLVSPFQKHEWIKETGEALAEEYGVPFYYQDFRSGFSEGVALSKEMQLYRQPYCGCVFSERDRYRRKEKK